MFELTNTGLILGEDTISENDFRFGAETDIEIPYNENIALFYYNQGKLPRTRNACVLYGNIGTISDLTGYEFSVEEILEIVLLAEKEYFRFEERGMTFHRGVDCVRNWWNNKFPNYQLMSLRLDIGDKKYNEALDKGHTLSVGYNTSREYYYDSQDDGVLVGTDFEKNGGHLVRLKREGGKDLIVDNYEGTKKYNTYEIVDIEALRGNNVYFPSAYLFLKKETMNEKIRKEISLENAKKFFDRGYTNGLNPKQPTNRQEMWATLEVILRANDLK